MKTAHYATLATAIILIALLYWGTNTIPPAKKPDAAVAAQAGGQPQGPGTMKAASFDSLLAAFKKQLPPAIADSVKNIENELTANREPSRLAVVYQQLADIYKRNHNAHLTAYYMGKKGKLENSAKTLTFAGQLFLHIMEDEHDPAVHSWAGQEAVGVLEQAEKLQPNDEDTKLSLATAYIEGTGEPMRGVQILRAITAEKPNDIPANMLLGRLSIQSGQFDKAITRFETILKIEPNNTEAMYFLAQAYEGTGNKQKTIELLTRCKQIINKPDFSREIDEHIKALK